MQSFQVDIGLVRVSDNNTEIVLSEKISDWNVHYADYQFIGSITTSIENREDVDGDIVAVFVDDKCRGIAKRMYFPFDDRYFYLIQVYSNVENGENMTFKYYDSRADEIVEYSETLPFTSNMIIGDGFDTFGLSNEMGSVLLPEAYGISNAYPNPFNPVTRFSYSILEDGLVKISIYDINGRMVDALVNDWKSPGTYPAVWDAQDLSSGVYIIKMWANEFMATQKIILIK